MLFKGRGKIILRGGLKSGAAVDPAHVVDAMTTEVAEVAADETDIANVTSMEN